MSPFWKCGCANSTLLLIALALGISPLSAQIELKGVGFDPTPVELGGIAQSEPRRMTSMDLLTIRDFHGLQISPDGKSVAFVVGQAVYESNSYRSGLFVVDTAPGSVPRSLGTAGPPRWTWLGEWAPEQPQWSPDSRYIAYRLRTDGIWQVWRWDRDGSNRIQLTHSHFDVADFSWSKDGKEITFEAMKPISAGTIQEIEERGLLYDSSLAVFLSDRVMDLEVSQLPRKSQAWVIDLASGRERELTSQESAQREEWKERLGDKIRNEATWASNDSGNINDPKLSPDGTKVIFQFSDGAVVAGHTSNPLYLKILNGGPPVAIDPGVAGVTAYWWSADGKNIYFSESHQDGHSRVLYVASADRPKPVQLTSETNDFLDDFSVDGSGHIAVASLENNTRPARLAVVDLKTSRVRVLVDLNPQFSRFQLSSPTRVEWVSKYREPGHGYLLKPLEYRRGQRYPLIITTYRSGDYFLRGGGGGEYPIQVFAANGFAVLAWDQGVSPAWPTDGNFKQFMLDLRWPMASLEAALNVVEKTGIVDPTRRGLTGWSHGTEIVGFVISHSDLFQAVISCGMGGSRDPYAYYMLPRYWKDQYKKGGLGLPKEESAPRWEEMSPSLNAQKIHAPILSNASEQGFMLDMQLYTTLEQRGKPVEFFVYPDEPHFKVQPKHLYEIYERNLDWFKFWFQNLEDQDPNKKAQYTRWHHMRELHEKDLAMTRHPGRLGSGSR